MKLNKKIETEVLKVYDIWLDSYLNGDVATYDSYFDDAYHFIGSTNNEEFLTRKETTKFFKRTAEQLAGKTDLRNETKTIECFDKLVFITHAFDAWYLNGNDWTYYGRFRFSSVMQKKEHHWKFIYQHFSTTDSKTDNGETIGFNKVNLENQELREAIKRRTFELEEKNRELEVEGALERIRTQAVAMKQSSDLLEIVVSMRNEFIKLGHEAHYFWHMMWLPNKYEKAMTSGDGTKIGFVMELPRHIHGDIPILAKWEKSKKQTVVHTMNVEDALAYIVKMVTLGDFQNIDPQAPTEDDIRHIGGLTYVMARTTHGEIGYSLPGIVKNPPKKDIDILVKFAGAFDLAHRRFLDLQKAEKQAREVQIELALEKVRSRTMAMQHSDELQETSFLLDKQVRTLGIKTWGCAFNIYGENDSTEWFGNEAGVLHTYKVPRAGIFKEYYQEGKKGESLIIKEFSGEACVAHYEYMSTLPVISGVLKTLKKTNKGFPTYQIDHVVYFKYGYLLFITRESVPDAHDIFKRFAKVFEQTYTRFLDLQKAEAQAKEAQIEAALERVRSRSMAMHKSEELTEAGALLYQELSKLGIQNLATGYVLFDETATMGWNYGVNPMDGSIRHQAVGMKHTKNKVMKAIALSWKKQESLLVIQLNAKETIKHQTFIAEKSIGFPISKEKLLSISPENLVIHTFNFKQGYLLVVGGELLSVAQQEMITRFAKVFQQTYTRFLDLQKAEKQAREAEIELALERIRARTMAMQKSEEIGDVAFILFLQLKSLGGDLWGTGFGFCKNDSDTDEYWFANEKGIMPHLKIPNTVDPTHKQMYEGWKKNLELLSIEKGGKELKAHYKYMLTVPDVQPIFKGILNDGIAFPKWQKWHAAYFKYGYLLAITTEIYENEEILPRFAKVFEQTYTRFLDLQKAEAQVREAQVEASLERVRSRSMAMQKSIELLEAGELLWNEITKLGIECFTSGYVLMDDSENIGWNYTPNTSTGKILEQAIGIPHKQTPPMRKIAASWKKLEHFCVIELTRKQTIAHQTFIAEKGINFPFSAKKLVEISPKEIVIHTFNFKQGYLLIIGAEKLAKTQIDVMLRFTKVFQQTYTRFLDLQKAEEQTREARINLAVERVRAKALAMHKSEEIMEVVAKLKDEVMALDIPDVIAATIFLNEGEDKVRMWDLSTLEKDNNGYQIPFDITFKLKKKDPNLYVKRVWDNPANYFLEVQETKDLKRIVAWLRENNKDAIADEVKEYTETTKLERLHHAVKKLNNGKLVIDLLNTPSEEMENILTKMGAAFDLAYKRFEDLQKAEAQAREAQIEAALERVRSWSMAMHKSEEMLEVIEVVAKQLIQLNLKFDTVSFGKNNQEGDFKFWISSKGQPKPTLLQVPFLNSRVLNSVKEAQKKGVGFIEDVFTSKENKDWSQHMIKFSDLKYFPEATKDFILNAPGFARSSFLLKSIDLYVGNYRAVPFTKEENTIFGRFAQVFEQAYTRFLDLQKAENQARESQIEAALEKVRSRSLAMHKPDELQEVVAVVAEKLQELGVIYDAGGVILCTYFLDNKDVVHWIAVDDFSTSGRYFVPYFDNPIFSEAWDSKIRGDSYFSKEFSVEAKNHFFEYAFEHSDYKYFPEDYKQHVLQTKKHNLSAAWSKNSAIIIPSLTGAVPSESDAEIMKRFAKVFEQAYIRFMDLQKAEVRARETQIDIALERVRSRTLAMQTSEELAETSMVVFQQLVELGIAPNRLFIGIIKDKGTSLEAWATNEDGSKIASQFTLQASKNKSIKKMITGWKQDKKSLVIDMKGKELKDYFQFLNKEMNISFIHGLEQKRSVQTIAYFSEGLIGMAAPDEQSEDSIRLLERFASVFNLTYTRFKDLKVAEAQSRDSQIQLSLERVRAKAMSMHNSDGIDDVLTVLCAQFDDLGILPMSTNMTVIDFENNSFIFRETGKYGDRSFGKQTVALGAMDNWKETVKQWKADNAIAVNKLYFAKEQLPEVWEVFHESFASMPENYKITPSDYPDGIYHIAGKHPFGYIGINKTRPATDEDEQIVIKFANEFGRAYQRFLDLQKAEAQTKEAKIEASLEKVRSVALSLTKSEDMLDIAKCLYEQLLALGFTDIRNAIIDIHNENEETFLDYDYSHDMSSAITKFSFYGDPVIEQQIKKVESSNDAFFEIELKGKQLDELIETRLRNGEKDDPRLREIDLLTYNLYSFGNGAIGVSNFGILDDDQKKILKRFRNVFTFAYKRYTDLAKAEAQAREAKIEAALEKVRSVALSMNESTDLLHITKALYEQLVELGFSEIRNALIDVNNEGDETFIDYDYSDEMGSTITHMSYDDDPTLEEQLRVIASTTDGYSEMVLEGQQLQDLINMRRKNGEADDPRLLKTDSLSYILYAFGNGAVGISNFGVLSKDQRSILDRFRNVFTFAYQRFIDLQVKEEQSAKLLDEKQRLEKMLTDLQQTQKQLIQSEKMASLGELTAGIAHEIQNPLNFVNNFSEVSKELLEEMLEEIEAGDMEEAKAIMKDIVQNLEKINHHGKRADGIVKGMLQHSRASGDKKEPTDINALTDEYLRLAYHGLRAKDKSFNANLETDYDKSIKTVNIISQDIGRVILNLFTNAFYAVDEKKTSTEAEDYTPTVSVMTKKSKNKIIISVKDNGNGIPKHVIDKIFQPFFTTKPTGKGTGLGLSMSYDIIKAHDGELMVNTVEGESTEFKIQLPLTTSNT